MIVGCATVCSPLPPMIDGRRPLADMRLIRGRPLARQASRWSRGGQLALVVRANLLGWRLATATATAAAAAAASPPAAEVASA